MLGSIFEELTSVNGRLLPTFATLIGRPGALSRAYRLGQWRRFIAPINVFLLANLVFFLVPKLTDFSVTLSDQLTLQPYSFVVKDWVDGRIADSGLSFDSFAQRYQTRSNDLAKTLIILHVPVLALVTLLLFADRRLYYADHVVTALHFFAFFMLFFTFRPYLIEPVLDGLNWLVGGRLPVFQISLALLFLYVPPMMRTSFGVSWPRAMATTLVFAPLLLAVHLFYRLVQLFIVMALL